MIDPGPSSHILRTPLDIFDTALEVFPEAAAREVIKNNQPTPQLQLWLSRSIQPITLTSEIPRKHFIIALTWAKLSEQVDDLIEDSMSTYVLRTEDFVLADPLKSWKKFRRAIYEQSDRKCGDLIISSFFSSTYDELLHYLEFAPDQVDANPSKSDLAYFRDIIPKCGNICEGNNLITEYFRSRYPCIYQRLIDELLESS
jgi:hypothetical protein